MGTYFMPNSILPPGPLNVRTTDSQAPSADTLLGRPHIPAIASAVNRIGATVKFVESPLDPFQGRDELLAQWERGIDVKSTAGSGFGPWTPRAESSTFTSLHRISTTGPSTWLSHQKEMRKTQLFKTTLMPQLLRSASIIWSAHRPRYRSLNEC